MLATPALAGGCAVVRYLGAYASKSQYAVPLLTSEFALDASMCFAG